MHKNQIIADYVRATKAPTKSGVTAALRAVGLRVKQVDVEPNYNLALNMQRPRWKHREPLPQEARGSFAWVDGAPRPATGGVGCAIPDGGPPLKERLAARREGAIIRSAKAVVRYGAAGGTSWSVQLTDDPSKVGYEVIVCTNRTTYRGKFRGWEAREDDHYIVAPRFWRTRVERRGLALLGGMLTLDAQKLENIAPEGVDVFRAVWVSQGRGYSVTTHHGYIAVAKGGEWHFHADTADKAVKGVVRKGKLHLLLRETAALTPQEFCEWALARASKGGVVRVSDAKALGACEYGIRSWCLKTGLPYEQGEAPIGHVIEAYRQEPQAEARGAILLALRRHVQRAARADASSRSTQQATEHA